MIYIVHHMRLQRRSHPCRIYRFRWLLLLHIIDVIEDVYHRPALSPWLRSWHILVFSPRRHKIRSCVHGHRVVLVHRPFCRIFLPVLRSIVILYVFLVPQIHQIRRRRHSLATGHRTLLFDFGRQRVQFHFLQVPPRILILILKLLDSVLDIATVRFDLVIYQKFLIGALRLRNKRFCFRSLVCLLILLKLLLVKGPTMWCTSEIILFEWILQFAVGSTESAVSAGFIVSQARSLELLCYRRGATSCIFIKSFLCCFW